METLSQQIDQIRRLISMQLLSYDFENRFVLKFTKEGLPMISHRPWLAGSSDGMRQCLGVYLVLLSHHPKPHKLQRTLSFRSEWQRKRSKQGSGVAHLKIDQDAKIHTLVLQKVSQDPMTDWDRKICLFYVLYACTCVCMHTCVLVNARD